MFKYFYTIEMLVALMAFINGAVCLINPQLAIKFQQKFYARINWRIEPIDLVKELRNTRIMGAISLILSIILVLYIAQ
jgi:hypothetical protein